MMSSCVIIGRMVNDPELKHTPNNITVTSFCVAVDRPYVKSGDQRKTDFIDVVAWRSTAEFICKYFSKGQMIAVQGGIQTRAYTDKDGNKRKTVEIVAEKVSFAGNKRDSEKQEASPDISWTEGPAEPVPTFKTGYAAKEYENIPLEVPMSDEDLPF